MVLNRLMSAKPLFRSIMVGYFQIMVGYLVIKAHYWRSENKLARKPIGLFLSIVYHTSPLLCSFCVFYVRPSSSFVCFQRIIQEVVCFRVFFHSLSNIFELFFIFSCLYKNLSLSLQKIRDIWSIRMTYQCFMLCNKRQGK